MFAYRSNHHDVHEMEKRKKEKFILGKQLTDWALGPGILGRWAQYMYVMEEMKIENKNIKQSKTILDLH